MVLEICLTKNYGTKCMQRKKSEEQRRTQGEGWFSIPRYNLPLSICTQNLNFLCYTVVNKYLYPIIQLVIVNLYTKYELPVLYSCRDIFDEKYGEKEKKEQIQGRTNRRRLILYPTIQLVIVNLYTKYKVCILNSFGDIFDEKVL